MPGIPSSRFLRSALPPPTPLPAPIFEEDEPDETAPTPADDNGGGGSSPQWVWSLNSKYASKKSSSVSFVTPETAAQQQFAADQLASPRSPQLTQSTIQPTSPRSASNLDGGKLVDVSGKLSTATGEGLAAAVAGTGASFLVYGSDREGRPVLSVGLLSSVLAVSLVGPHKVTERLEALTDGSVRVWYTPKVSGRYSLRVGVRSGKSGRIEPLPGSPFAVDVAPRQESLRGERRKSGNGGGGGVGGVGSPASASEAATGDGGRYDASGLFSPRSGRSMAGAVSHVKASDVRLRVQRGLMATAVAGERARLELVAPMLGGGRVELPGRMRCVLHLQSQWCEADGMPPLTAKEGGKGAAKAPVSSAGATSPGHAGHAANAANATDATDALNERRDVSKERYFKGRVAFAPYAAQPGFHHEAPNVRNAAFADAPYASPLEPPVVPPFAPGIDSVDVDLAGGGEDARTGGTLLYASFCVPRAGTYLAHVTLDQGHVVGSPLVLRVAPAATCAVRSEVLGAAAMHAMAGRHESCTVWLRDTFGNARRATDEPRAGELTASLELLSAHETAPERPGEYVDEYYGAHDNDAHAAHADSWPSAVGSSGARDSHGGLGGGMGGGSHATLAAAASASVATRADGSFAVAYTLRRAGVWALSLAIDGEPVGRSPYAISCWPGSLYPPACDLCGTLHEATAGVANEVEVRARDRYGNRLRSGGGGLRLTALPMDEEGAPPAEGAFIDHDDGRYSGTITCYRAGRHALSVTTADGAPLYGSPFLLTVAPSVPMAERCALLQTGAAGSLWAVPVGSSASSLAAAADEEQRRLHLAAATPPQPAVLPSARSSPHSPGSPRPRAIGSSRRQEEARRQPAAVPGAPSIALRAGEQTALGLRVADAFGNAAVFEPAALEVSIEEISGALAGSRLAPSAEYDVRALYESASRSAVAAARAAKAVAADAPRPGSPPRSPRRASKTSNAPKAAWTSLKVTASSIPDRSAASSHTDEGMPIGTPIGGSGVLLVRIYRSGDHIIRVRLGTLELPGSPVRLRVDPTKVRQPA